LLASAGIESFSQIPGRVAYPVEPCGVAFVEDSLPSSPFDDNGDSLGKQTDLLDQFDDGHANQLEFVHKPMVWMVGRLD
jgi:hypothetical protein